MKSEREHSGVALEGVTGETWSKCIIYITSSKRSHRPGWPHSIRLSIPMFPLPFSHDFWQMPSAMRTQLHVNKMVCGTQDLACSLCSLSSCSMDWERLPCETVNTLVSMIWMCMHQSFSSGIATSCVMVLRSETLHRTGHREEPWQIEVRHISDTSTLCATWS